jgi:hypothetical protein
MKRIKLTQGKFAIIDDDDYEKVSKYKWHLDKGTSILYARSTIDGRKIRLHRFVTDIKDKKLLVDHNDSDGLNCQKGNLTICNHSQNGANTRKIKSGSSRYKGVRWVKARSKWNARITVDKVVKHLGTFSDENDAGKAYNAAAVLAFGEFARINTIENNER